MTRAGRAFLTVVIKTVMKGIQIRELLVSCHLILKRDQTIIEVLEPLRSARVEKIKRPGAGSTGVKMGIPPTNMETGAGKVVEGDTEPTAMLVIKIGGVGIGEKAIPEDLESYRLYVVKGKKKKSRRNGDNLIKSHLQENFGIYCLEQKSMEIGPKKDW